MHEDKTMKHIFIVNKISGKGKGYKTIPIIENICKQKKLDYEIFITEYIGHAKDIASKYNSNDDVTVYAVGGDGTLLEVVNGLDNNIPLGAIPGGSGEDFLRYFHIKYDSIEQYILDTIEAEPIIIDIAKTDRMKYLNTTSYGIDATINLEASYLIRNTIITKGPAYIISIIRNAIALKATKAKIIVDDKTLEGNFLVVSIMNGKYYGNGVMAAPNADMQDGYLDLTIFEKRKGLSNYPPLIKYLTGKSNSTNKLLKLNAKKIVIDTNEEVNIQSDGENYASNHLEVEILENYLKLKIPTSR